MARLAQVVLAALSLYAAAATAQVPVPPLKARVTDLTATLSPGERGALEQKLSAFEARKGSQVAVLLVPSTRPETVEQFAIRVFDQWKLGRKGVNDGALLLVAKNDRKLRIEVGRGLEGVLPDAVAKRIIEEEVVPRFKQGDFHGGIAAGVDRMLRVIDGEPLPPPPQPQQRGASFFDYADWLIIGLVLVVVISQIARVFVGRLAGAGVTGALAGFIAWFVVGIALVAAVVGAVAFVVSLVDTGRHGYRRGGWSSGDNWSSGGSWSSGDGGFSGGGGDSGGGGASGSW